MSFPDGWSYEGPDESVGIFGYEYYHDACCADLDNFNEVELFEVERIRTDDSTVLTVSRLVCFDCTDEAVLVEEDFDPIPSWWDEMDQVHEALHFPALGIDKLHQEYYGCLPSNQEERHHEC
jgi:hypothetical protein